jgi:hypothetical protein
MRFPRIVGYLIIGAILGVLFVYALGWRKTPTIALVDGKSDNATFILRKGQILKWESATGDAFSIDWLYGASPCKDLVINSKKDIFTGVETATCEVVQTPPSGVQYVYGIGPPIPPGKAFDQPQTVPCYGCSYGSSDDALSLLKKIVAKTAPPSTVRVSCASTMDKGSVSLYMDPAQVPNPGLTLTWDRVANITSMDPPVFDASSGVSCTSYTCTFPSDASKYPMKYSIAVTGTDGGTAPAYCGAGTVQGTGNGTISGLGSTQ